VVVVTCGNQLANAWRTPELFGDFFGDSVRRSGTFGAVSFRFDGRHADARERGKA
jgi:hypothetical protein